MRPSRCSVIVLLVLACSPGPNAWGQPVDVIGDEPGVAPAPPPPASQPAASQPAPSQPAPSQPAPSQPRAGEPTTQPVIDLSRLWVAPPAPPRVRLRTSVSSALVAGNRAGWGLAFILATPALLDLTLIFGKLSGDLADQSGEDFGGLAVMGMFLTVPVTIGSGVLGGLGLYAGGSRLRDISEDLYDHALAKQAFRAGFLQGLGKGFLLAGGIGTGFYGLPLLFAAASRDMEVGWDDWTWPAWVVGLIYSGTLLLSGAVILGVGSSRATDVLERVSVVPLALPMREGAGLALVHRF